MEQTTNLEDKRKVLSDMLYNHVCEVTFTKINGEKRVMPCTLKETLIPVRPVKVHVTNTDNPVDFPKVKKENPDTMSVYCMDKKEWRSFRIENVTNIKVIE